MELILEWKRSGADISKGFTRILRTLFLFLLIASICSVVHYEKYIHTDEAVGDFDSVPVVSDYENMDAIPEILEHTSVYSPENPIEIRILSVAGAVTTKKAVMESSDNGADDRENRAASAAALPSVNKVQDFTPADTSVTDIPVADTPAIDNTVPDDTPDDNVIVEKDPADSVEDVTNPTDTPVSGWKDINGFKVDDAGYITGYSDASVAEIGLLALPVSDECTGVRAGAFTGLGDICVEVYIPANITNIETDAFSGLPNLIYIEVDTENPAYYSDCGILYSKDGSVVFCPGGR